MTAKAALRACVLLPLALGGASRTCAQNFDFRYTSNGVSVAGTFVTTAQGNGQYLITSILNGLRGGNAITLLAPGTRQAPFGTNNNLLTNPANPGYFTGGGFAYSSAGQAYSTTYNNGRYFEFFSNTSGYQLNDVFVAPAPLPGGGLLSFLALGLFGTVRRRAIVARVRAVRVGTASSRSVPVPAVG